MKARLIEGKMKTTSLVDAVGYQIATKLIFSRKKFDDKLISALAIICINGDESIAHHATALVKLGLRKTTQSARNYIQELLNNTDYLTKDRDKGGRVSLSSEFDIVISDALIINYKIAYVPEKGK